MRRLFPRFHLHANSARAALADQLGLVQFIAGGASMGSITSPNHTGTLGIDSGEAWMLTGEVGYVLRPHEPIINFDVIALKA